VETNAVSADLSTALLGLALLAIIVTRSPIVTRAASLPRTVAVAAWWAMCGAVVWFSVAGSAIAQPSAAGVSSDETCPAGSPVREFSVSLINIPIFLNRFGDVVPEGRMYVLDENIQRARATFADAADPYDPMDIIEPLTLRVNKGDCVEIDFTNRLDESAPSFDRNDSIFPLPGEVLHAPGTPTAQKRHFAPALTQPHNDFDPSQAPPASMHFDGLTYSVQAADGTAVGSNTNTTVQPGAQRSYTLHADVEGQWQFKDGADFSSVQTGAGNFIGSHAFGAFGAIVVEPEGATWVDARTGEALDSGTRALIKDPNGPDFREHVLYMHDEVEAEPGVLTRFCVPGGGWNRSEADDAADDNGDGVVGGAGDSCVRPTQAQIDILSEGTLDALSGGDADALVNHGEEIPVKLEWFAFNYRAEPGFNREELGCPAGTLEKINDAPVPECIGEETSLSSWVYGDPGGGDLIFANYRGEPTRARLIHPAEFETHTFHWHVNRWPLDPADEGGIADISDPGHHTSVTNILDVQAVSPGDGYDLVAEGGAGSAHDDKPATFGDIIFHCHLYPHFANGMWGLNRTHDKLETGNRLNPDGTPILPLEPIEDFDYQSEQTGTQEPPTPTAPEPGFPHFVPGTFGLKAPKPPLGVASRQLGQPAAPTALEVAASDLNPGDQVPGGFFQDPCPDTRSDGQPTPQKLFEVSAIQTETPYNPEAGWSNPQARVYASSASRPLLPYGREPFAPLLTVGDCVTYELTNELPLEFGGTVFDREQLTNEVGIHQHMVQFDVLSSDGAANGWNYDQGADADDPSRPDVTGTDTTIFYRNFVHADTVTNSFHDHFFPNVHQDNGLFGGATIHPPGCEFYDPYTTGSVQEPRVRVMSGTVVDVACGPATDYHGTPVDQEDYRNVALFIEDHVPMFKPAAAGDPNDDAFVTPDGVPIFPPKFPSSADDYGVMGVNYALEPFENRRTADPSKLFSTATHGYPYTPVIQAYEGELVKWRLFQLSQEESHGFNLDRFPWSFEPNDPDSDVIQAQHMGMLEYFDVRVDTGEEFFPIHPDNSRSYMYHYGGSDDWFLGAWGLLEVRHCTFQIGEGDPPELPHSPWPLPDTGFVWCPLAPSAKAAKASAALVTDPICPIGAPRKEFAISAIDLDIQYNDSGDHDPNGLMYALAEEVDDLRSGTKEPEPLVIRVNAGDCIEIELTNELDPELQTPHCHEATEPGQLGFKTQVNTFPVCIDEPPRNEHNVPGFRPFPVGNRVSLRPTLVTSQLEWAGSYVGRNPDGTVGPGESITYLWHSPSDLTGLALLQDRGDVQNHLHHGLFGALVIEPAGSTYLDPRTGAPLSSGADAVIVDPAGPDFRENVVLLASDQSLRRENGDPVPDNLDLVVGPSREADDPEDQGEVSVNYRNEPWVYRYQNNQDLSLVFSSTVHGDPATPIFSAYAGDPVRFLVAQAAGKPRSTGFALHGHRWRRSPDDPQSEPAAFHGRFNPGVTYEAFLDPQVHGGAGGATGVAGDYLYRTGTLQRHLTGGQWGIFRVHDAPQTGLLELPDRASD
jgi:manganese oxidase